MMKVIDLKENEGIGCETWDESERILKLMHNSGLKWESGFTYKYSKKGRWFLGKLTCYLPFQGLFGFSNDKNYTVYKSTDF